MRTVVINNGVVGAISELISDLGVDVLEMFHVVSGFSSVGRVHLPVT